MLFLHNKLKCDQFEMMMKFNFTKRVSVLFSLMAFFLLHGCSDNNQDVDTELVQEERYFDLYMGATFKDTIAPPTESGLFYINVKEGTGDSPGEEDWVMMNHVAYTIPDETVVDSYIKNVAETSGLPTSVALFGPFKFQNGTGAKGLTEGLGLMHEGGGAIMCFTSELGFGPKGTSLMRNVGGYKSIKYEVVLLEVIGNDIVGYEQNRIEAYVDTIAGVDTIYDSATETVMYFVVDEPNEEGSTIGNDSVVEISYRGYLIDGREFDASVEGSPYKFKVNDYEAETSPISGWHLGVTRFREGEKGRLIIPYPLAYGEKGRVQDNTVAIPQYETLIFDIKIDSVGSQIDTENPDI
jgi:FKBP-type peptidyl-prolyl cis-trans isomerase